MRIESRLLAANELTLRIREMQAERTKAGQAHMAGLVQTERASLCAWFGDEAYAALTALSEDRAHSAAEYEDALSFLRPYDDAFLEKEAVFEACRDELARKIDALVGQQGFSGRFPHYIFRKGRCVHSLSFVAALSPESVPEREDGALGLTLTAQDMAGYAREGSSSRIMPGTLIRSEVLAPQEVLFTKGGALPGRSVDELLIYVNYAAGRALLQRLSHEQGNRYVMRTWRQLLERIVVSVFAGIGAGLFSPLLHGDAVQYARNAYLFCVLLVLALFGALTFFFRD